MSEEQKVADWCRWYEAAQPSYKAHALLAVAQTDAALLPLVIQRLDLTLEKLLLHMREEPGAIQMQTKQRRNEK
jgi:hypothetical protein